MDFSLKFSGSPGNVSANLLESGSVVATAYDLEDGKDARKWARKAARDHKVANTPDASHAESVTISGESSFSL